MEPRGFASTVRSLLAFVGLMLTLAPPAAAEELPAAEKPQNRDDLRKKDPPDATTREATGGAGVFTLAGQMAIIDPGPGEITREVGGGFDLNILFRRKAWPVFVGFGFGVLMSNVGTRTSTTRGWTSEGGSLGYGVTDEVFINRAGELRHVDLLLRVQPFWGIARPYVEGLAGIAGVSETTERNGQVGELDRGVAGVFAVTLGVDWRLWSWGPGPNGTVDLVLSTGVKRLFTTPVDRPVFTGVGTPGSERDGLEMWVPFAGIGLAGASGS